MRRNAPSRLAAASAIITIACGILALLGSALAAPENWREIHAGVLKSMRSESVAELEMALEPLRDQDHEEASKLLLKVLASTKTPQLVKERARDVLASYRSEESRDCVFDALRWKPSSNYLLLEAFAGMRDPRAPEIGRSVLARLGSERNKIQVFGGAIRCLAAAGAIDPTIVNEVLQYTAEGHPIGWRIAAADSALQLRAPAAVERLIELLDDPGMYRHVRADLVQLAGEDLGSARASWQTWWVAQGKKPPEAEATAPEVAEVLIAAREKTSEEAQAEADGLSFYGIPIEGKNILFVLDASTSMRGYPLDRLKSECSGLVAQLPETHRLALVFFPGNETFSRELELATPTMKKRANAFIKKRQVVRGTPTGKAMQFAFKRYGGNSALDAIYLISDGAPTKPIPEVIALIDGLNAGLYIPIHTIFIGQVDPPQPGEPDPEEMRVPKGAIRSGWEFLKEVARRHNGTFNIVVP